MSFCIDETSLIPTKPSVCLSVCLYIHMSVEVLNATVGEGIQ
jgi:hypothetical protein